jgi:hypothetical protein
MVGTPLHLWVGPAVGFARGEFGAIARAKLAQRRRWGRSKGFGASTKAAATFKPRRS